MFCSTSVGVHLFRGVVALLLIALGIYGLAQGALLTTLLSLACFGGAFVAFRGCPMCWTIGLFETIARQRAKSAR